MLSFLAKTQRDGPSRFQLRLQEHDGCDTHSARARRSGAMKGLEDPCPEPNGYSRITAILRSRIGESSAQEQVWVARGSNELADSWVVNISA